MPMLSSWEKIDYRLRPAKSVERKMFAEAFRKLSEFGRVDAYRYVGMGSLYFSDFILFHRVLGFKKMVSIEGEDDSRKQERFGFNLPFSDKSIDLKFGAAKNILPKLNWNVRSVVWLDYDKKLKEEFLSDIAFVCSMAITGSLLMVSINAGSLSIAEEENEDEDMSKRPLDILKRAVGTGNVPPRVDNKSLTGWGTAKVYRDIIKNTIEETLKERNGVLPHGGKIKYRQLFNFHYADGAKMLTVGGVLFDEAQEHIVSRCAFDQLEFYRPSAEAFEIPSPRLTFKEIRALDRHLPSDLASCNIPIPQSDIEDYSKVYRYFPTFAEAEI
jgi:hypothetical protein